jgi:hypothetical protein
MGGDMTGKSPTRDDYEKIGRRGLHAGCWIFYGFGSLVLEFW